MLNTLQTQEMSTTANGETSSVRWFRMLVRMLATMLREHSLSHRAATASALHRRSVAELRQLYLRLHQREQATSEPVRTAASSDERLSTGYRYFAPSRHSFGK